MHSSRFGLALTLLFVAALGLVSLPGPVPIFPVHAQDLSQTTGSIVGQLGGETRAVLLDGEFAYAGIGPRLFVFDLSDASAPRVVHRSAPLPGTIQSIVRQGSFAFLTCGRGCGLRVFDLSEPERPSLIAGAATSGEALDVAVAGSLAVVADGTTREGGGLLVFDIANPRQPRQVGLYPSIAAKRIALREQTAFVATGQITQRHQGLASRPGDLEIIDLSNPSNPERVIQYDYPDIWSISAVAVRGNLMAFVYGNANSTDDLGGLYLVNIERLKHPKRIGHIVSEERAFDLVLGQDRAYFVEGEDQAAQVHTIDISDPARPLDLGTTVTPGLAYRLSANADQLLVADGHMGLSLFSVVDGTSAELQGQHVEPASIAHAVWNRDQELQVGSWGSIDRLVETSTDRYEAQEKRPLRGGFMTPETITRIGDWIAAAHLPYGVSLFGPEPDDEAFIYEDVTMQADLQVVDDTLFVSGWDNRTFGQDTVNLHAYDLSQPDAPENIGYLLIEPCGPNYGSQDAYQIDVSEGIALLADTGCGVRVVDVADPTAPQLIGTLGQLGTDIHDVAMGVEDTAYAVSPDLRLFVIDLREPAHPRLIREVKLAGPENGVRRVRMARTGNRILIAGHGMPLIWLDIEDPAQPKHLRSIPITLPWRGIHIDNDRAFLAADTAGVWVLDLRLLDRRTIWLPLVAR